MVSDPCEVEWIAVWVHNRTIYVDLNPDNSIELWSPACETMMIGSFVCPDIQCPDVDPGPFVQEIVDAIANILWS